MSEGPKLEAMKLGPKIPKANALFFPIDTKTHRHQTKFKVKQFITVKSKNIGATRPWEEVIHILIRSDLKSACVLKKDYNHRSCMIRLSFLQNFYFA